MSASARNFRSAGRGSRCRACFFKRSYHAHHVVYDQELQRRGLPRWDKRNALPVCPKCHERHHKRMQAIPLICLTDENIEYAFAVLGAYGYDYLRQRYAGDDERLEGHLERTSSTAAESGS